MPRRSRGCEACRHRRIGCDQGVPSCHQCLATGRKCSGPVRDAIIIDQTEKVSSQHSSNDRKKEKSTMVRQPSAKPFVLGAFVAQFASFMTPVSQGVRTEPWLYRLEDLPPGRRGPALEVALQAAATAYVGVAAGNHAVLMEACGLYGRALSQHAAGLAQRRSGKCGGGGMDVAAAFCTSVVLALFETVHASNGRGEAYAAHLTAARRMLVLAEGEEVEASRMVREIAFYVQYQTLFSMVIAPGQYRLAAKGAERWEDLSRFGSVQMVPVSGALMTELFRLGDLFTRVEEEEEEDGSGVVAVDEIERCVERLWVEYLGEGGKRGETTFVLGGEGADGYGYWDESAAMTVSYFAATRMLVCLIRDRQSTSAAGSFSSSSSPPSSSSPSPSPKSSPGLANIEAHAGEILNCCSFLVGKNIGCALLRMFFPLILVAMHSPDSDQRKSADWYLKNWLHVTAFSGLNTIVDARLRFIDVSSSLSTPLVQATA